MACIYRIFNTVNDKSYIGQTTMPVEHRFKSHLRSSRHKPVTTLNLFHRAIREIGERYFFFEVLYQVDPFEVDFDLSDKEALREHLSQKERYYIEKYDSLKNGYNSTWGGAGNSVHLLTPEERKLHRIASQKRKQERMKSDPEYRAHRKAKQKKYTSKPEYKERRRIQRKEYRLNNLEKVRKAFWERVKRRLQNPEYAKKYNEKKRAHVKAKRLKPEWKEKNALKRADPLYKARKRAMRSTPEYKAKRKARRIKRQMKKQEALKW